MSKESPPRPVDGETAVASMVNKTPDFDVALIASIDVPSTWQLSLGERADSVKVMHDDLVTLAENDGCIAAAWALDAIKAMATKIRLQTREQQLAVALRDVVKAMETWGSWEDGIPSANAGGEMGKVGAAYDRARVLLSGLSQLKEEESTDVR